MVTISILGCGWLGLPLAEDLAGRGYKVKGSTTTPEKTTRLKEAGIIPFLIFLHPDKITGDVDGFLYDSELLILAIPPGFNKNQPGSFVRMIQCLIPSITRSSIRKVLFISSTSVYSDHNQAVFDTSPVDAKTASGLELRNVEIVLQETSSFQCTILRFGGLIGENRHPVHYLSGRANLPNPEAPVNLIHLSDGIGVIKTIIEKKYWGHALNAVNPDHPTRFYYYTEKARQKNLPPPLFNFNEPSVGKKIIPNTLIDILEYSFLHPL